MRKLTLITIIFTLAGALFSISAAETPSEKIKKFVVRNDSVIEVDKQGKDLKLKAMLQKRIEQPAGPLTTNSKASKKQERESIFDDSSHKLGILSHFTWGADIGASIDLGANNRSTFDADVNIGYKNKFFSSIGVGCGIHHAFGTGDQLIPVYFLVRTSFRPKPSLFFLNLKAGYSFNTLNDVNSKGGFNLSVGCGINLAISNNFRSHLILSYGYFRLSDADNSTLNKPITHIDQIQLRFGVSF